MLQVRARVRPGHVWIFANDVLDPPVARLEPGQAVDVVDERGRPVGRGYANPHSLICIRLVARGPVDLESVDLWRDRLATAWAWRQRALPGRRSMRVCAGEADGLPGLVVDRYEDVLVAQITTFGMDRRRDLLRAALDAVFAPRGVVARDDASARVHEGLGGEANVWFGDVPAEVEFEESGVSLATDPLHGQKTGFFFDQAENRAFLRARAAGARVLDLYAHVGGWALAAMAGGAREAVAVDSSATAVALVRANAARNGVADRVEAVDADARRWLVEAAARGERFDVVCVDPPAFAKNRKSAGAALSAYKQVNTAAAAVVAPGGFLYTSSCSHHILPERFEDAVHAGLRASGRRGLLIRRGGQAPDHPILPGVPESEYLKHLVYVLP
jgi:23S rRNA (cytosine1962-C5)-methyltransferase